MMAGFGEMPFFEDKPQWITEKETIQFSEKIMSNLSCKNYGFDCNFTTNGPEVRKVIKEFREHTMEEHHIDYPEGILMKFITNKKY